MEQHNNLSQIKINNQVNINELLNNKSWIHGTSHDNITITIFLITIESHLLQYALEAINSLETTYNVLVNVIMNVSPTKQAYNTMIERCTTQYFIQLDEDMEMYPNGLSIILDYLKSLSDNKKSNCFVYSFKLIDNYLGLSNPPVLYGLKVYNFDIMKNFHMQDCTTTVSQVDKTWHAPIYASGYIDRLSNITIGFHARNRKPFDIMLRFSKSTSSFMNFAIRKNSGDYCRILRPINKIANLNSIYSSLFYNMLSIRFDNDIYKANFEIFSKSFYKYINPNNLISYNIPEKYNTLPKQIQNFSLSDFIKLSNICLLNMNEYYVLIGIINRLFDNYSYSFKDYPYKVNNYFSKVFEFRLGIFADSVDNIILDSFNCYDNFKIYFLIKSKDSNQTNTNNTIYYSNEDDIKYNYLFDLITDIHKIKEYDNINEFHNYLLSLERNRKNILITNKENINIESIKNKHQSNIYILNTNVKIIKYDNSCYYINPTYINDYSIFDTIK